MLERLAAALDGSGPAILPLEADLPPERLARILDAFAPSAVETPDGLSRRPQRARGIPVSEQTAVVIATSGSTGRPKGVELSASALTHSARASLARVGAVPGDRWLLCLPATHIAGIQVLVRSLVAGTEPVIAGRLDPAVLEDSGCAHVSIVPTQLRRLLAGPDTGTGRARTRAGVATWAGNFKSVLLGGAAASGELIGRARQTGIPVVTTYGMTETCGGCVYDGLPLERGIGDDRGRRPDPDQRTGTVLRLPAAPGPVRGRAGRRLVRHLRPGRRRRGRAAHGARARG